MMIDTELLGLLGYTGYIAIIAGIAYQKFLPKTVDGVQIDDITTSVEEAKVTFDQFLTVVNSVIDNKEINDAETIAYIKEAIKVMKEL
jgi:SMC interacting uncharacterized protein involved in chromosome segregation